METEKELNIVSNYHFLPDYRSTIFILVGLGYYHPCYFFLPDPVTKINVIHIEVLPPIVLAHVKDQWCRVPQKNANPRKKHGLMDFLVYGNRKCLWIQPSLLMARVNCTLGFDTNGRLLTC